MLSTCPLYRLGHRDPFKLIVVNNQQRIGMGSPIGISNTVVVFNRLDDRVDLLPTIRAISSIDDVPYHYRAIALTGAISNGGFQNQSLKLD